MAVSVADQCIAKSGCNVSTGGTPASYNYGDVLPAATVAADIATRAVAPVRRDSAGRDSVHRGRGFQHRRARRRQPGRRAGSRVHRHDAGETGRVYRRVPAHRRQLLTGARLWRLR